MPDNIREVTSCCNYPLLYKDEGDGYKSQWDFCGMCLKSDWEIIDIKKEFVK